MAEVAGRGGRQKKVAGRGGRRKKVTGKGGHHEEGVWSVEPDLFRSGVRRWKKVEEESPEKVCWEDESLVETGGYEKRHSNILEISPCFCVKEGDHVTVVLCRYGFDGAEGAIHYGEFDITYMAYMPNMVVMAPSNEVELINTVATTASIDDRPNPGYATPTQATHVANDVPSTIFSNPLLIRKPL
ncbi:plant self-incompatibility protein S1 family protein [Tanacetum coccineum]|uniref:Plant self-incompatibility protein S1 family protein n=1 Tax=Tanacetum coccineum TaxID=301880 RepID=A0ABQ5IJT8_9ASTR